MTLQGLDEITTRQIPQENRAINGGARQSVSIQRKGQRSDTCGRALQGVQQLTTPALPHTHLAAGISRGKPLAICAEAQPPNLVAMSGQGVQQASIFEIEQVDEGICGNHRHSRAIGTQE
jgi:hypothetical protein